MIVSLDLVKKNVRADDLSEYDGLLQSLTDAAEEYIIRETNRTIPELMAESSDGNTFPLPLQQAVLMLVAHWFNQPEAVAGTQMVEVPYTIQALVLPYRRIVCEQDL